MQRQHAVLTSDLHSHPVSRKSLAQMVAGKVLTIAVNDKCILLINAVILCDPIIFDSTPAGSNGAVRNHLF